MSTLHHAGYLHRDLSCSNVLLTQEFDCKLIDFGLSVKGTVATNRCGSLAYMAPEVLNRKPATCAADWWSYGIIVYAMFAGKTPLALYAAKKHVDVGALTRDRRYSFAKKAPVIFCGQLPLEGEEFLRDILRPDPESRLGTKDDMNFDLVKAHRFFNGFNWTELDRARVRILRRIERKSEWA